MRSLPAPLLAALLLPAAPAAGLAADAAAHPRPAQHHRASSGTVSDMDQTLARRAEEDRLWGRPDWDPPRPLTSPLPPATRQRIAAPPLTGWGYGGTVPGALPGF